MAEVEARGRVGTAMLMMLVSAILVVGIALFLKNFEAFVNAVSFYVNVPVMYVILGVVGLIAMSLWLGGCALYAGEKGHSWSLGFVLGFLAIVGLLVLLVLPPKKRVHTEAGGSEDS